MWSAVALAELLQYEENGVRRAPIVVVCDEHIEKLEARALQLIVECLWQVLLLLRVIVVRC